MSCTDEEASILECPSNLTSNTSFSSSGKACCLMHSFAFNTNAAVLVLSELPTPYGAHHAHLLGDSYT